MGRNEKAVGMWRGRKGVDGAVLGMGLGGWDAGRKVALGDASG